MNLLGAMVPAAFAADSDTGGGKIGSTVYVIPAEQPIESGLEKFLKRAYKEAEEAGAERIVLVIDTLGGSVVSAEGIGDLVRTSKVPTTALVHGRAVSAGTYIALNADELVMEPNSVIGSAAVVDGTGTLIDNPKTVAYWTQKMRAAAEINGRDPNLATAMVNPNVTLEIKPLGRTVEKGELLALSAADAVKVGYADYTASSVDEVLAHLGIEQPN
ncbi:ATP-dependent Clp protease proteolytic subunit, partial [Paenibacillus sepulcri]|nr:ATP-dependent Clp protease proteolytic subunit [Paenibacillus sepulcri]